MKTRGNRDLPTRGRVRQDTILLERSRGFVVIADYGGRTATTPDGDRGDQVGRGEVVCGRLSRTNVFRFAVRPCERSMVMKFANAMAVENLLHAILSGDVAPPKGFAKRTVFIPVSATGVQVPRSMTDGIVGIRPRTPSIGSRCRCSTRCRPGLRLMFCQRRPARNPTSPMDRNVSIEHCNTSARQDCVQGSRGSARCWRQSSACSRAMLQRLETLSRYRMGVLAAGMPNRPEQSRGSLALRFARVETRPAVLSRIAPTDRLQRADDTH